MITIIPCVKTENKIINFEARDNDELLGVLTAFIDLESKTALIDEISCSGFILDGLCRAALSYAENRGIATAKINHPNYSKLGDIDIENFFKKKC